LDAALADWLWAAFTSLVWPGKSMVGGWRTVEFTQWVTLCPLYSRKLIWALTGEDQFGS
jgi:hypothetical protein